MSSDSAAQNAPQGQAQAHFNVIDAFFYTLNPSPETLVDRCLLALDRLACCEPCKEKWIGWLLDRRWGTEPTAVLAQMVLEIALQRCERHSSRRAAQ